MRVRLSPDGDTQMPTDCLNDHKLGLTIFLVLLGVEVTCTPLIITDNFEVEVVG